MAPGITRALAVWILLASPLLIAVTANGNIDSNLNSKALSNSREENIADPTNVSYQEDTEELGKSKEVEQTDKESREHRVEEAKSRESEEERANLSDELQLAFDTAFEFMLAPPWKKADDGGKNSGGDSRDNTNESHGDNGDDIDEIGDNNGDSDDDTWGEEDVQDDDSCDDERCTQNGEKEYDSDGNDGESERDDLNKWIDYDGDREGKTLAPGPSLLLLPPPPPSPALRMSHQSLTSPNNFPVSNNGGRFSNDHNANLQIMIGSASETSDPTSDDTNDPTRDEINDPTGDEINDPTGDEIKVNEEDDQFSITIVLPDSLYNVPPFTQTSTPTIPSRLLLPSQPTSAPTIAKTLLTAKQNHTALLAPSGFFTPMEKNYHSFSYTVVDPGASLQYGHREVRRRGHTGHHEGRVEGQYHVLLPDGATQVVKYHADSSGYHPTITYHKKEEEQEEGRESEEKHPPYTIRPRAFRHPLLRNNKFNNNQHVNHYHVTHSSSITTTAIPVRTQIANYHRTHNTHSAFKFMDVAATSFSRFDYPGESDEVNSLPPHAKYYIDNFSDVLLSSSTTYDGFLDASTAVATSLSDIFQVYRQGVPRGRPNAYSQRRLGPSWEFHSSDNQNYHNNHNHNHHSTYSYHHQNNSNHHHHHSHSHSSQSSTHNRNSRWRNGLLAPLTQEAR